jgi:hypothetical protein
MHSDNHLIKEQILPKQLLRYLTFILQPHNHKQSGRYLALVSRRQLGSRKNVGLICVTSNLNGSAFLSAHTLVFDFQIEIEAEGIGVFSLNVEAPIRKRFGRSFVVVIKEITIIQMNRRSPERPAAAQKLSCKSRR